MAVRVIQWTTGNVGRASAREVLRRPGLELVGVYAHSKDKVGTDVADILGLEAKTGITATNDVDALLAVHPDVCVYTPVFADADEMCRILEAGINIVSTAAFLNGRGLGKEKIAAAAVKGGVSVYGSGMNPGMADLLAIVATHTCGRIEQIRVLESVNVSMYESAEGQDLAGMGHDIDEPGLDDHVRASSRVFEDAVEVIAEALGITVDEITFDADYVATTEDQDFGYMFLPKGTVGAVDARWRGWFDGRDLIVLRVQWVMGSHLETPVEPQHGYTIEIDGNPGARLQFSMTMSSDIDWSTVTDFMGLGMSVVAMPAVNAIEAVIAAPPGIATYATLPHITGPVR